MGKKDRKPDRQKAQQRETNPPATRKGLRLAFIGVGILVITAIGSFFVSRRTDHRSTKPPAGTSSVASKKPHIEDFSGSEACARCHQKEYDLWKRSTHGLAGGEPGETMIIARFDGQPLHFKDATVTPITTGKGECVFIVEQEGAPKSEIKVHAAVGGGHMYGGGTQSFFQRFADGTVRFLPFDFIRREGLWFVQLRDKTWAPITKGISLATDLANWPPHRALGTLTESSNCQNCHGSQIAVTYDAQQRRYETHYQSLTINCESCHGPGKHHIEIVSKPGFENLTDVGMEPLATLSKDRSLAVCFQCHATKDVIREEPYLPGAPLENYFSLKLPIFEEAFTVDGRVRDFGYQSTHLFSDCYLNGSMTCVDCHDPHSQRYRDVFGKPLAGRFDNGQCTSCHASKAVKPEAHSHHKAESPGNACVACHMPYLQHQSVGERLMFARSDHSIPIPRPEFDQRIGIENACQKCHRDKDLAWQQGKMNEWYGAIKPHHPSIANLIKAADVPDESGAAKLLLDPSAKHPMAQMAGLVSFTKRFLRPDKQTSNPEIVAALKTFAESTDLDLQAMALVALDLGFDQQTDIRSFLEKRLNSMNAEDNPVRSRWAVALDYFGNAYASSGDFGNAIAAFKKSVAVRANNIVAISHLAMAYLQLGDSENAISWLKTGVKLRPEKAVLHFQLAQTYARSRQFAEAIKELEAGLIYAPEDQTAQRMLQQLRRM
jgi:hypothetical protein